MPMNDPLGDMLTRIRNAQMRRRPKTSTPASKLRVNVLEVLQDEGYIRGYTQVEQKGGQAGRRVYSGAKDIPTVSNGLGVAILSTPKGVMSDWRAREENVGGEVLCNVF